MKENEAKRNPLSPQDWGAGELKCRRHFFIPKITFPKNSDSGNFSPKNGDSVPKNKDFYVFYFWILSLYPLKPFIYADSDILPFFPKTLLRKITMSVITLHYPVFCNFRYPPLLPLDTLFMPRKARKKEPWTYYVVPKLFLL